MLATFTFILVIAGGLVTSNDAALSIPDWPLSWGRLVPVLEGGIRYEFAHRTMALIVTLMTGVLAFRLRTRLAWAALAAVCAQVALGGVLVRFFDPKLAAVAHAALAQFFFGFTVLLCLDARRLPASIPTAAAIGVFAQTILGAAVRHGLVGPVPHIAGAIAVTILVMFAAIPVLISHMEEAKYRRPAMRLLSIVFSQVFLGIGAWMSRLAYLDAPQPMPVMVFFTVAHVAVGSLAFGAALALAVAAPPRLASRQGALAA